MQVQPVVSKTDLEKALSVGRPPNVVKLFPHSRALIVSGKVIDRAMIAKGHAIAIAASARNSFVAYGALRAAQRANALDFGARWCIIALALAERGMQGAGYRKILAARYAPSGVSPSATCAIRSLCEALV